MESGQNISESPRPDIPDVFVLDLDHEVLFLVLSLACGRVLL